MTIEEYISTELDDKPDPSDIIFLGFETSPSHVWSEWTSESFSCTILFDRKSQPAKEAPDYKRRCWSLYLDEQDVCDFLNKLFPAPKEG